MIRRSSMVERAAIALPVLVALVGAILALAANDSVAALANAGEWFAGTAALAAIVVLVYHRLDDQAVANKQAQENIEEQWRAERLEALATVAVLRSLYRHDMVPPEAFGQIFAAKSAHSAKLVSLLASSGMSHELKGLVEEHLALISAYDERAARPAHDPEVKVRQDRSERIRDGLVAMELEIQQPQASNPPNALRA